MDDAGRLDLAEHVRPGDRVVVGQVSAEPRALAAGLAAARPRIGPFETFVGTVLSDSFDGAPADTAFASYGAMGRAAGLARRCRFEVWPIHYSALETGFATGAIRADVVLIQLVRGPTGLAAALAHDYVLAAARRARVVVAEINAGAPWCAGGEVGPDLRIDAVIETEAEPVALAAAPIGPVERAIAAHAAALVPDRATVQVGIGAIPEAIVAALGDHRDLGIHTGALGDALTRLVETGVVTNAHKTIEPGSTITNTVVGSRPTFDILRRDSAVRLRPAAHTHAASVLARQERFVAINSAIEVDLLGQINAETVDGRPVGGAGGLVDFSRGAATAPGGRAIVALRSTDRTGKRSRIVPRLETVTIARTDVDTVVTEHGVAELRHLGPSARARALIAVAHPDHREALSRALAEGGLA